MRIKVIRMFLTPATACLLAGLAATEVYAQEGNTGSSLEILMETDGTNFKGLSRKVRRSRAPELHRQVLRKGFYYIEALDSAGRVRRVQTMPASNEVIYDYFDAPPQAPAVSSAAHAGAESQGGGGRLLKGGKIRLEKAQFLLKLPYDADIKTLKIHILKDSPARKTDRETRIGGARQAAASKAPEGRELKATIDLGAIPEEP